MSLKLQIGFITTILSLVCLFAFSSTTSFAQKQKTTKIKTEKYEKFHFDENTAGQMEKTLDTKVTSAPVQKDSISEVFQNKIKDNYHGKREFAGTDEEEFKTIPANSEDADREIASPKKSEESPLKNGEVKRYGNNYWKFENPDSDK